LVSEGRPESRDGAPPSEGLRVAIVVARYHDDITTRLMTGARARLAERGIGEEDIEVAWAPGAFELPLIALGFASREDIDAVICLGCVIRGDTDHYQWVCQGVTHGIQQVSLETGIPIGFGVLTCDTIEQADARAGGAEGCKGTEAADAVLDTIAALDEIAANDESAGD